MASSLASHGYVVLAADLYGGQAATTPEGARQLVTTFDSQKGIENLSAAAQFLRQERGVEKLATIGWCFGGGQSFNYALSGDKLDGTVIYYGRVSADKTELAKIQWPVLGIFGELDTSITKQSVQEFEASLDDLGIENEIYIYPGVNHAFANPSGASYAPEETEDAWQKTIEFLDKHLNHR
jgi:carboxymethylenebutenolidase